MESKIENSAIELRVADHAMVVSNIVRKTIEQIYPHYYPVGAVRFFLDLHNENHIKEALLKEEVYLAIVQGEIVGTGSIRGNEICRLFILPEYQGKGYGSNLMDILEEKIFKRSEIVRIDASFPAEQMYLKRGYQFVSYEKMKTKNGDFLCYHGMEKRSTNKGKRFEWNADSYKADNNQTGNFFIKGIIRPIKSKEYSLLKEFLYDAIYLPKGTELPPKEIIQQPELAVYVENFGQPDDICLLAEIKGNILGAVWTRILAGERKGYGNIDAHTPELAISVKKAFRRQGIGKALMKEMIALLQENGYKKVSLSVNKENGAYQMYQQLGFQIVNEQDEDYQMVLEIEKGYHL